MGTPTSLSLTRACLLLVGMTVCTSCVTTRDDLFDDFGRKDEDCVRISVENHGFYDVTVYVLREGIPFRLGTVAGSSTVTFRADQGMIGKAGSYQLMADQVGAKRTTTTDPIPPIFGSTTVWRLEQSEWQSTVVIR
jgi:hypothetical protein